MSFPPVIMISILFFSMIYDFWVVLKQLPGFHIDMIFHTIMPIPL